MERGTVNTDEDEQEGMRMVSVTRKKHQEMEHVSDEREKGGEDVMSKREIETNVPPRFIEESISCSSSCGILQAHPFRVDHAVSFHPTGNPILVGSKWTDSFRSGTYGLSLLLLLLVMSVSVSVDMTIDVIDQ